MKTNGIFSASSRSAIAKLFSRTSATSSSAKSGALLVDERERARHAAGGTHALHAKAENPVLEIERDERVILDDQNVVGHSVGSGGFHDPGLMIGCPRRTPGGGLMAGASPEARRRFPI